MKDFLEYINEMMGYLVFLEKNTNTLNPNEIVKKQLEIKKQLRNFCFFNLSCQVLQKYNVLESYEERSYLFTGSFWDVIAFRTNLDNDERRRWIVTENSIELMANRLFVPLILTRIQNTLLLYLGVELTNVFSELIDYCKRREEEAFGSHIIDCNYTETRKKEQNICELCGAHVKKKYKFCAECGIRIA